MERGTCDRWCVSIKTEMSPSNAHAAFSLLVKNINFKSLKYLNDLIWSSDTGLRRRKRESSLIICNPLILYLSSLCLFHIVRHSMAFFFLATSLTLLLRFHCHCLGVFFTFSSKEICLWVVDCRSLFISLSALRGIRSPIQLIFPSACQSARRPVSLDCMLREGGEPTWPKACHYTPRGNKADMTAWWHLLLYIISFYQSSAFHLCETQYSNAKCQACWPS